MNFQFMLVILHVSIIWCDADERGGRKECNSSIFMEDVLALIIMQSLQLCSKVLIDNRVDNALALDSSIDRRGGNRGTD